MAAVATTTTDATVDDDCSDGHNGCNEQHFYWRYIPHVKMRTDASQLIHMYSMVQMTMMMMKMIALSSVPLLVYSSYHTLCITLKEREREKHVESVCE